MKNWTYKITVPIYYNGQQTVGGGKKGLRNNLPTLPSKSSGMVIKLGDLFVWCEELCTREAMFFICRSTENPLVENNVINMYGWQMENMYIH